MLDYTNYDDAGDDIEGHLEEYPPATAYHGPDVCIHPAVEYYHDKGERRNGSQDRKKLLTRNCAEDWPE